MAVISKKSQTKKGSKAKKKTKKITFKRAFAKAKAAWSVLIRTRDNGVCFTCGRKGEIKEMQNGHMITAEKKSIFFDPRNCHCQCPTCNYIHEFNPEVYFERFIRKYGVQELTLLIHKGNTPRKYTVDELLGMEESYKRLTEEINQRRDYLKITDGLELRVGTTVISSEAK